MTDSWLGPGPGPGTELQPGPEIWLGFELEHPGHFEQLEQPGSYEFLLSYPYVDSDPELTSRPPARADLAWPYCCLSVIWPPFLFVLRVVLLLGAQPELPPGS